MKGILNIDFQKDLSVLFRGVNTLCHWHIAIGIDSIVDQLNDKSNHLYKLPFELTTLRNSQRKDQFFAPIISYL